MHGEEMKYFLVILLSLSSSLYSYIGEDINGLWNNPKHETFIELDTGWNYQENYYDGTFLLHTGGMDSYSGFLQLKGNKLILDFNRISNNSYSEDLDYRIEFTVYVGVRKSGLRYIKLISIRENNKYWNIGPLYFRHYK